ncbi:hypothetical protein B0H10DRAFT_1966699 [Mycena sp. CBHHK59/15]|nr:hypothetical protein B0H10DRAFT_1966699 [Mycena sp. CBHHK59/15]
MRSTINRSKYAYTWSKRCIGRCESDQKKLQSLFFLFLFFAHPSSAVYIPDLPNIRNNPMPNFPTHLVVEEALARPVSSSDKLGKTYLMEADGEDTKYGQTNDIFRHRGEWAKQCPGQVQVWRQCWIVPFTHKFEQVIHLHYKFIEPTWHGPSQCVYCPVNHRELATLVPHLGTLCRRSGPPHEGGSITSSPSLLESGKHSGLSQHLEAVPVTMHSNNQTPWKPSGPSGH